MRYEVYKIIDGVEKPLAVYNNLKDAQDMCNRLNSYKEIYFVREIK